VADLLQDSFNCFLDCYQLSTGDTWSFGWQGKGQFQALTLWQVLKPELLTSSPALAPEDRKELREVVQWRYEDRRRSKA
jgi:hypothetical protein